MSVLIICNATDGWLIDLKITRNGRGYMWRQFAKNYTDAIVIAKTVWGKAFDNPDYPYKRKGGQR